MQDVFLADLWRAQKSCTSRICFILHDCIFPQIVWPHWGVLAVSVKHPLWSTCYPGRPAFSPSIWIQKSSCYRSICILIAHAHTQGVSRWGGLAFSRKFPQIMALVRCPCAFRPRMARTKRAAHLWGVAGVFLQILASNHLWHAHVNFNCPYRNFAKRPVCQELSSRDLANRAPIESLYKDLATRPLLKILYGDLARKPPMEIFTGNLQWRSCTDRDVA